MNKIWKPIIYNNQLTNYEISNYGDIRNINTGKIKTPMLYDGVLKTHIRVYKKDKWINIALEILRAFKNIKKTCDDILIFKDGDITNLYIENLMLINKNYIGDYLISTKFTKPDKFYRMINEESDERWDRISYDNKFINYMISDKGRVYSILSDSFIKISGYDRYPFFTVRTYYLCSY